MREVIAKRVRSVKAAYIFLAVLGAVLLILGIVGVAIIPNTRITFLEENAREATVASWFMVGIGVFLAVVGTVLVVRTHGTSDVFVSYENDTFYFQDGSSCSVGAVTNVNYQLGETLVAPVAGFPDSLTIEVGEKVYHYTNVDNCQNAQSRMLTLMLEFARKGQK